MSWKRRFGRSWGRLGMIYKWGELISLEYGKPIRDKEKTNGKYPVYGTNGQIGTSDLSPLCNQPSFILGRKGAYRGVHYSAVPFSVIDTAFYAINLHPELLCIKWAYYKFLTYDINSMDSGSAIPSTDRYAIYAIEVDLPDVDRQRREVRLLECLDNMIINSSKINDHLQQQAAALFANFYDHAETEVDFTEIIQILGGGTPKTSESSYWNGNVPFFTPKDVGSPYTLTTEKTITEEGLAHCNSRLYPVNTVFVTARGTVGKVGLSGVPMAMNQSCYALVGKDTHPLLVYFYTLKAVDRLKHKASGAVFDAITTRDFESEIIMKLSDDDAKDFLDVAEPIYQAILSNSFENLRLAALRDSLLPKLMSGEIDVSSIPL